MQCSCWTAATGLERASWSCVPTVVVAVYDLHLFFTEQITQLAQCLQGRLVTQRLRSKLVLGESVSVKESLEGFEATTTFYELSDIDLTADEVAYYASRVHQRGHHEQIEEGRSIPSASSSSDGLRA